MVYSATAWAAFQAGVLNQALYEWKCQHVQAVLTCEDSGKWE